MADVIAAEHKTDLNNWATGTGHATPAFNSKSTAPDTDPKSPEATFVQTGAKVNVERKAKMVTNTAPQVAAELAKEEVKELVTPTQKAGNDKDSEPK